MIRTTTTGWSLGFLFLFATAAEAVAPVVWEVTGVEGWTAAERDSVGLSGDGMLRLGRAVVPIEGLESAVVWDLMADGQDLLAATGDSGKLYRIDRRGGVVEAGTAIQPEITGLGRDASGAILAGTSPDGTVYRLEAQGLRSLADTPETYVWRILPGDGGGAVVATGDRGRLYRISRSGEATLLADLDAVHVTGLERWEGGFLAATESPGRLVAVDGAGRTRVLYDAEGLELRAPVTLPDGTVYFLANPATEPGRLLCRRPSGAVEEMWRAPAGFAYDLTRDVEGTLWIATGSETGPGALFRLDPEDPGAWTEAVRLAEPQILRVRFTEAGGFLATGGRGRVFRLAALDLTRGAATSPVRDAGGPARWGALAVDPRPQGAGVEVETRSGETRVPDAGWSDWAPVRLTGGDRGAVSSPPARFLQWRATLRDPRAAVRGIRVTYLPANRPPRVQRVTVSPLGAPLTKLPEGAPAGSLIQSLSGGVRVEFQVPANRNPEVPAADAEAAWARRFRSVQWEAEDPNGDALRFDLSLRAVSETEWKPLVKDLESSPWVWDSASLPDGWYQIRMTASDRAESPPGGELEAEGLSDPFLVDNTPPRVLGLGMSGGALAGSAQDESSPIKRIEIALDGEPWRQVFPEDGIPDLLEERFAHPLPGIPAGDHVAVVRAFDAAGNPGTGRLAFRTP